MNLDSLDIPIFRTLNKTTLGVLRALPFDETPKNGDELINAIFGTFVFRDIIGMDYLKMIRAIKFVASLDLLMDGFDFPGKKLWDDWFKIGYPILGTPAERAKRPEGAELDKLLEEMTITSLSEKVKYALTDAKPKFEKALSKAVEEFANEPLRTLDRVLVMAVCITATLLVKENNLADALASCKSWLEVLHSLPAVQECFTVEMKKGSMTPLSREFERRNIIAAVCHINRIINDVVQMVLEGDSKARELLTWPCIVAGDERVDPLRDVRVPRRLLKHIQQECSVVWSFPCQNSEGQDFALYGVSTNKQGQFTISSLAAVYVFDNGGKFLHCFSHRLLGFARIITTDQDGNVFVLIIRGGKNEGKVCPKVFVLDDRAKVERKIYLETKPGFKIHSMTVDDSNNILVSVSEVVDKVRKWHRFMVQVYENRDGGKLLHSIEVTSTCTDPRAIKTSAGAGRLFALDCFSLTLYIFAAQEKGYLLKKTLKVDEPTHDRDLAITFHGASEYLFMASYTSEDSVVSGDSKDLKDSEDPKEPEDPEHSDPEDPQDSEDQEEPNDSEDPEESEGLEDEESPEEPDDSEDSEDFYYDSEDSEDQEDSKDRKSETRVYHVSIYTKDGQFVRRIPFKIERGNDYDITGIAVANDGSIVVGLELALCTSKETSKVVVL